VQQLSMTLAGTRPLLQHNVRLADPLEPITQRLGALTSKRKKTLADHEDIARVEFEAGLYFDEQIGPYVKSEAVERCLRDSAARHRLGKAVQRGVLVTSPDGGDAIPLLYRGPRDIEALYADKTYRLRSAVGVQANKTMRTRPRFPDWRLECLVLVDDAELNAEQLREIAVTAGQLYGLGDYRPRYGRFEVSFN
jgi:hypothetical protein